MEKTIETIQQEQPAPTCKSCGFYENNCPFIRDTFKPYPNKVCKDYTHSVMKAQEQPETDLLEEVYMRGFAQGAKEERERMREDIIKMRDTAEKCGLNFGAVCGFQIALDELEQRLTGKH